MLLSWDLLTVPCFEWGCLETNATSSGFRFDVSAEVIQNRLPALTLELGRVVILGVEGLLHQNAVGALDELDLDLAPVAHLIFDRLSRHDAGERAFEVEALATVLGFHAGHEFPALAKVDGAMRRVPVVLRGVPLLDVGGGIPGVPNGLEPGSYDLLDGDLHRCLRWSGLTLRRRTGAVNIDIRRS